MGPTDVTLVGHDIGGMIVCSYLWAYQDISRAVIMNVGVPGVGLREETLHNPHVWHFGFHTTPDLPERLVRGRQEAYFEHFFDMVSADPAQITPAARAAHIVAYSTDDALTAGFNWYRAFGRDADIAALPAR